MDGIEDQEFISILEDTYFSADDKAKPKNSAGYGVLPGFHISLEERRRLHFSLPHVLLRKPMNDLDQQKGTSLASLVGLKNRGDIGNVKPCTSLVYIYFLSGSY
jgi:hypothetical protein